MTLTTIFILIACGILTNLMSALFGIGGGVLMVPILHTLFPEFPLQMVAATSLMTVMGTATINLIYFYKQQNCYPFSVRPLKKAVLHSNRLRRQFRRILMQHNVYPY